MAVYAIEITRASTVHAARGLVLITRAIAIATAIAVSQDAAYSYAAFRLVVPSPDDYEDDGGEQYNCYQSSMHGDRWGLHSLKGDAR